MNHSFDRLRPYACALLMGVYLAACGGGDPAPTTPVPPAIVAKTDALNIAYGATGDLLANDSLGSAAALAVASGPTAANVSFSLTSTLPSGVTIANGVVAVAAGAVPGAVTVAYTICQAGNAANCASVSSSVTIPAPPIVANADTFSLSAGGSGDLLANDTLAGAAASSSNVSVTVSTTPLPTGVTVSDAGVIAVGTAATAGSSTLAYRICQKIASSNCANGTATLTVSVASTSAITGKAIDSATGAGIPNVTVRAGASSTSTDASGAFTLSGVSAAARTAVRFSSTDYAETSRITAVQATGNTDVQARMVKVALRGTVPVDAGGTVSITGSPAQVVLPAAGFQRADGSLPTGNVTVLLTPIDPAVDSTNMPGDYTTSTGAPIESFGAINVTLQDSTGAALNLRSGQTATLRIPLASRNGSPPASVPLFWFDTSTGRWVQEGSATLAGSGTTRYYEGTVSHFTTWNADQTYNTVIVSSCLADANGVRIANATVLSDGVDYSGTSSATTDGNGNFSVALKRSATATITGVSNGRLTNTVRVGPLSADTSIAACLTLGTTGAGITMKLTWGQQPSDLDSHLYTPSGAHVYFGSKGSLVGAPNANLDVDDTSSYGPEVVTVTRLMVGTYRYSVRNYTGQRDGLIGASGARVELNLPGRTLELFTPPATGESIDTDWWNLFEFDVDAACSITVRRLNAFSIAAPTVPAATTPVYCTP